ncbi:unnamed protein product [Strongylus vulgaris]|uniref:Uncharacterized protein n=1 Tax=Strongylus vulgaris TaxID=40348 RepID=A0A3P7JAR8_STRVU|nr:unnamed protein product [Strongylus vulgaris]
MPGILHIPLLYYEFVYALILREGEGMRAVLMLKARVSSDLNQGYPIKVNGYCCRRGRTDRLFQFATPVNCKLATDPWGSWVLQPKVQGSLPSDSKIPIKYANVGLLTSIPRVAQA